MNQITESPAWLERSLTFLVDMPWGDILLRAADVATLALLLGALAVTFLH